MSDVFAELNGQVAIVTGAAKGIGRACAKLLASNGVHVVVADIDVENGERTAQEIIDTGGKARFSESDVGQHAVIRTLVEQTVDDFERLDIVVNNAYWSIRKSVVDLPEEEWDKGMNVMLKSAYLFGKYAFPIMARQNGLHAQKDGSGGQQRGAIVNIASVHGYTSIPNYPVYAAAKAGLINLSRQMALDGAPHGIRVNAICPGWIKTGPVTRLSERRIRIVEKMYPLGRGGEPDEIAKAVRFLVSSQASYITGHALVVDGGMTAQLQDAVPLADELWESG